METCKAAFFPPTLGVEDDDADVMITSASVGSDGTSGDQFGLTLGSIDAWNGDIYADLLVGAPYADGFGVQQGAFYLFEGPISNTSGLTTDDALLSFTGITDNTAIGIAIAGLEDMNGDG